MKHLHKTRERLSVMLIGGFVVTFMVVSVIPVVMGKLDQKDAIDAYMKWVGVISGGWTGIVGVIVGYYFGSAGSSEGEKAEE